MTLTRRSLAAALAAAPLAAAAQPAAPRASAEQPILLLDQVRSAAFPRKLAPAFEPLKTLEAVEAVLKANGVAYKRGPALIDSRSAPPSLMKIISGLPPGEIFIVPEGGGVSFSQVVAAITPDAAARILQPAPAPRPAPKAPRRDRTT